MMKVCKFQKCFYFRLEKSCFILINFDGSISGEMGDNLEFVQLGTDFTPLKLAARGDGNCVIGTNSTSNHVVKCWGMSLGSCFCGHHAISANCFR